MTIKLWPNGLGWNIGRAAEVWQHADGCLGVRTFYKGAAHRAKKFTGVEPTAEGLVRIVADTRRSGELIQ